jgi:hypothetical protein
MNQTKTKLALLILCVLQSIFLLAQAPIIQWQKCYGGSNSDGINLIRPISANSFLFMGGTNSNDYDVSGNHGGTCGFSVCSDVWLIDLDSAGNILWQKCIGGSNLDIFSGVPILLNNGHLLFAGGTYSNDGDVSSNHFPGRCDGWLVETDSTGNVIWQKCYGGSSNDGFNDIKSTPDGGYILIGLTVSNDGDVSGNHSSGFSVPDVWVVKLDSARNIVWQKCLGGSDEDDAWKVFLSPDGGYIIGGYTRSNDGDVSVALGGNDIWIVKIDSIGGIVWEKSYGGSVDDMLSRMVSCNDGGYLLAGNVSSMDGFITGNHDSTINCTDIWIVKIDSVGILQWQKCLGGKYNELCYGLSGVKDGFIVSGMTNSDDGDVSGIFYCGGSAPYPCDNMWLVKIDSSGVIQWQKCMGGSGFQNGYQCLQTSDNGYFVSGVTTSFDGDVTGGGNHGSSDGWLIKLSPQFTDISEITFPIIELTAYLNSNNNLTVHFFSNKKINGNFCLYDIAGKALLQKELTIAEGINNKELVLPPLTKGIYIISLLGVSTKLVVQ